jgi:hypothetical protein
LLDVALLPIGHRVAAVVLLIGAGQELGALLVQRECVADVAEVLVGQRRLGRDLQAEGRQADAGDGVPYTDEMDFGPLLRRAALAEQARRLLGDGLALIGRIGKIGGDEAGHQRVLAAVDDAEGVHQAGDGARREGAAGEAEHEDLVARAPVGHQKAIALRDVVEQAAAKGQAVDAVPHAAELVGHRRAGQLARVADAGVVVDEPVRVGVQLQQLCQQHHVGVRMATAEVVVGAIAQQDQLTG